MEEASDNEELDKKVDQELGHGDDLARRVEVSEFDYSVENYFSAMAEIEALCGTSGGGSPEVADMEHFSSMITFLKEWKYFTYDPKTVSFAYETKSGQIQDLNPGITLSQFSAAAVPKMEESPVGKGCLDSNDFVLNAGGLVWALDWCPQIHEDPGFGVNCEYLAVAAHAPGATYHKIGAPLVGRGLIQIWCILCPDENEISLQGQRVEKKTKKKTKKESVRETSLYDVDDIEVLVTPRPRGRPKKQTFTDEDLHGRGVLTTPKPRGRPRKGSITPNSEDNSSYRSPICRPKKRSMSEDNSNSPKLIEKGLMLATVDLSDSKYLSPVKSRGRPKKTKLPLRKARGRPRKHQIPDFVYSSQKEDISTCNGNQISSISIDVVPLQVDSAKCTLALPALPAVDSKSEVIQPKRRGRPRKTPFPNLDVCVSESGGVSGENAPALPECTGDGTLDGDLIPTGYQAGETILAEMDEEVTRETSLTVRCDGVTESSVKRPRGRPRKNLFQDIVDLNVKEDLPTSNENQTVNILPKSLLNSGCSEVTGSSHEKPRGRPTKRPHSDILDLNWKEDLSPSNVNQIQSSGSHVLSFSADLESTSITAAERCKEEITQPRCRGRPRKRPCFPICDGIEGNDVYLNGKEELPQCSENQILNIGHCIPPLCVGSGNKTLASLVSASVNLKTGTSSDDIKIVNNVSCVLSSHIDSGSTKVSAALPLKEDSQPRRRGRPRKIPFPSSTKCVSACDIISGKDIDLRAEDELPRWCENQILSTDDCIQPLSVDSGKYNPASPALAFVNLNEATPCDENKVLNSVPCDLPLGTNSLSSSLPSAVHFKEEVTHPRRRGRPRKEPSLNDHVAADVIAEGRIALKGEGHSLQFSGHQNLSYGDCIPPLYVDSGNDTIVSPLSASVNSKEVTPLDGNDILNCGSCILPLHADTGNSNVAAAIHCKEKAIQPKCRGRPRKEPSPTLNECVTPCNVISGKALDLKEKKDLSLHNESQTLSTDNCFPSLAGNNMAASQYIVSVKSKEEDVQPRHSKRHKNKKIESLKECLPDSGIMSAQDAAALPTSSGHGTFGRQQEISVKSMPSHDNTCQDKMFSVDRFTDKSFSQAKLSRPLIPKHLALPRVVLCLAHNGKVVWDLKWRRSTVTSDGKQHMGYLAVLLGSGSLEVWKVPLPSTVKALYSSSCIEGTDPRFIKLDPVFRCSKVKCGDRISIPLTVEWSPSLPGDLILAGCHDGTVALWKFSFEYPCQDTKPLLCFTADAVPIRALAWAPEESGDNNLFVTAGHEGLKFWDLRDPYHPLWELNPAQRAVLSLDWLKDPRCIIMSFDDGTLRILSLSRAANDVPVTGESYGGKKNQGLHAFSCSSFAIWSLQVSRSTGFVAYCTADGSAVRFQLTTKSVEKEPKRYRLPHFLCGLFLEEDRVLKIKCPLPNVALENIPFSQKKVLSGCEGITQTNQSNLLDMDGATQVDNPTPVFCHEDPALLGSADTQAFPRRNMASKSTKSEKKTNSNTMLSHACVTSGAEQVKTVKSEIGDGSPKYEVLPPKIVAVHSIRWNMNKGSEKWLCYGGAAGIIRCQKIVQCNAE